ncbi:hypothetical protein [Pseudactinotalea sp. HY158]|uniref:hypothetical protein n=1 Tax=Pseudactinotalea sp. HY158 TaxID=2654547 RepID=UPI00129CD163|nr:hypothetical protein [Pseudactinotalea sp. HY158]QGH70558.1 hypothetical protein GCE65_14450 [Pseudactinotalea sp. HY158]
MATRMAASDQGPRSAAAQESAVELHSVIEFLNEHLGSRLLALALDVDHRTIGRWLTDRDRTPQFDTELKVRATYQVFQALQPVDAPATIRAWFMGMNPQLEDRSPAEAIRDGDARAVMAAARAFINAG